MTPLTDKRASLLFCSKSGQDTSQKMEERGDKLMILKITLALRPFSPDTILNLISGKYSRGMQFKPDPS